MYQLSRETESCHMDSNDYKEDFFYQINILLHDFTTALVTFTILAEIVY